MSEKLVIPIQGADELNKIISDDGGFNRGHMFEIFGPDGEGKTTLALILAVSAQKLGLKVGWIDAEFSFNDTHARFFGMELPEDFKEEGEKWNYLAPENGEEALKTMEAWCKEGYGLIICDSAAGLVPQAMDESEIGESKQFGQLASLFALGLPKVRKAAYYGNTCVILLNQIRARIAKFSMGPPTESAGGYTLKHAVSGRFEVRKVAWIKYAADVIGFKLRIRAPKKNRFAVASRDAYIDIISAHDAPPLDELNKRKKTKIEAINIKED